MYFKFFNEAGRKICRQDGCGDLFSASLTVLRHGGEYFLLYHSFFKSAMTPLIIMAGTQPDMKS